MQTLHSAFVQATVRVGYTLPPFLYVTQFAKTRHNDAFLEFQIFASVSFHVPKALFCSNINVVLLIVYELQG